MRFTCLIINFLQVRTFQQGPVLERRKTGSSRGEKEREEQELKAECPLGIQAVPCQIQKQASLSSFFILLFYSLCYGNSYRTSEEAAMSTSKHADRLWPNGHTRCGH